MRLARRTTGMLGPDVAQPDYDRDAAGAGIVHLGVGAFMRAHTAIYCEDAMAAAGGDWRIAGVSLRSGDVRDRLEPQDCLYTLCVRNGETTERRLVGALASIEVAPEDPAAVVARLADPATKIVTLTVTEKGYCLDPGSGRLDTDNPQIAQDLGNLEEPRSTIGFLVAALAERFRAGQPPVTIVSCDNLPGNGDRLRAAVLDFAAEIGSALRDSIADRVAFPATMVDRIVPATTDADIVEAEQALGVHDAGLVTTEPFRQWVIEDRFVSGRPAWDAGGALFVDDVEPYEAAKLKLLNGAHSSLAYLGYLAGYRYVHEVMADANYRRYLRRLMQTEISPVTPEPAGMAHEEYIDALFARFANPALGHRTWQIAMDGSQKLPQRLLCTIEGQLDRAGPIEALCLAVAGWMRYVGGRDDAGEAIDVSDPLAERLAGLAAGDAAATVDAFLSLREVFGERLPGETRFRNTLTRQLDSLAAAGAAATVARCSG